MLIAVLCLRRKKMQSTGVPVTTFIKRLETITSRSLLKNVSLEKRTFQDHEPSRASSCSDKDADLGGWLGSPPVSELSADRKILTFLY